MAKGKRHSHKQQQRQTSRAHKPTPETSVGEPLPAAEQPLPASSALSEPSTASATVAVARDSDEAAVPPDSGPVLGLTNLGNTCFFNSAVQASELAEIRACLFLASASTTQLQRACAGPNCCTATARLLLLTLRCRVGPSWSCSAADFAGILW